MARIKAYRSVNEIMDIFKITLGTVNSIIKKHKVDSFSGKGTRQIYAKDFYKAYITYFNPSLFDLGEKKSTTKTKTPQIKVADSDIFQKLFGISYKKSTKRTSVSPALIGAKDHRFG